MKEILDKIEEKLKECNCEDLDFHAKCRNCKDLIIIEFFIKDLNDE